MKMKLVSFAILCTFLLVPTIASAEAPGGNVGYTSITSGRAWSFAEIAVGLISVVIGWLALARSAGRFGTGNGRNGAIAAMVVGLIGIVLSGLHMILFTGGFGTGSGRAGAIVAMVVGLIGIVLGWRALTRSRRAA